MKIKKVEFIKSSTGHKDGTSLNHPQIAFAGRSNSGKSSLINRLLNRKNMAKVSQTPGRTQLINLFNINDEMIFADLPGYGFAKVSPSVKKNWGKMVEGYLKNTAALRAVVLISDIRREFLEDDFMMMEWLKYYGIPFILVMNKSDKLSRNEVVKKRKVVENTLKSFDNAVVLVSSCLKNEGIEDIWLEIEKFSCGIETIS